MRELAVLVSPIVWSLKNDIVRFNRAFYRKAFLYICSSALFIVLVTELLSVGMARLKNVSPEVFHVFLVKGYSLIFLIIFFIQIINGIALSLNVFFHSQDLEVLLTSPVNRASLFFSKLIETHIKASWMLVIFGIPLVVSSGLISHVGVFYYFYALGLLAAFSLIPVNVGAGLAIFFASIFHARRMKRFLLSFGIAALVLSVTLLRMFRPERFVNPELFANLTLFINEIKTPSFILLPNRWLSEGVFGSLGKGWNGDALIFTALLFLTAYVTTFLIYLVFARYHARGWVQLQEGDGLVREKKTHGPPGLFTRTLRLLTGVLGAESRTLMNKDILCQARDVKNVHQSVILLSLIIIYLFSISSLPLNWEGYAVKLRYMLSFFNLGLILIIIASLCSRVVYPAVVSEAGFMWILRTSPVAPRRYILTKFLLFFIPVLVLGELLGLFSSFFIGIGRAFMLLIIFTIALVSVSQVSVAIAYGVADLKKGRAAPGDQGKAGSTLQMFVSLCLILLTVSLEAVPTVLFFVKEAARVVLTQKAWAMIGAVVAAVLVLNVSAAVVSMRRSVKGIDTLERY